MKTLKEIKEQAKSLNLVADKFDDMLIIQTNDQAALCKMSNWCIENAIFVSDIETDQTGAAWLEAGQSELLIDPNYQDNKHVDVMDVEPDYMQPMSDKPTADDVLHHILVMELRAVGVTIDYNSRKSMAIINFKHWEDCNRMHEWLKVNDCEHSYQFGAKSVLVDFEKLAK